MKSLVTSLLLFINLVVSSYSLAFNDSEWLGFWQGDLKTGDQSSIELTIKIDRDNNGYKASWDVPSQGGYDIPFSEVKISGKSILLIENKNNIKYVGELKQNLIIGTYTQHSFNASLQLKRLSGDDLASKKMLQEPQKPLPYEVEEVIFNNRSAGHSLAGTLTIPRGKIAATAILISGSGASTRNQVVSGHKTFLVVADRLTRQGIAVLRYDDRGVADSGGNHHLATSRDFANDANAAFSYLKNHNKLKDTNIGFIGHSEGGLIGAIAATQNHKAAFLVSMAGPGTSGVKLMTEQSRQMQVAANTPEEVIKQNTQIQANIMQAVAQNKSADELKQIMLKYGLPEASANRDSKAITSPWFRFFVQSDSASYYRQIDIPVLAINGELDTQVVAKSNIEGIKNALASKPNSKHQFIIYPGLNHLFQPAKTGLPNEYGEIKISFSEQVLTDIANWIKSL